MGRALRLAAFSTCVGAALIAGAEGCGLFVELDDLSGGDNNNASDERGGIDGGDAGSTTTGDAFVGRDYDVFVEAPYEPPPPPDGGCSNRGGPQPVRVTSANVSFCVDTTEVTRAQYAAFLATDPKLGDLLPPQVCTWKTGFVPTAPWPPSNEEESLPATNVDWCDAMAFCTWSGKHLCGKIGGGAVANPRDTNVSEFLNACSKGGTRSYPYGNTYEPQSCNGVDLAANRLVNVSSLPKCVVDGIFDMSGNAHELVNSCSPAPDAGPINEDICEMHLGAYDGHGENDMKCSTFGGWRRDRRHPAVGFRCCGN